MHNSTMGMHLFLLSTLFCSTINLLQVIITHNTDQNLAVISLTVKIGTVI